MAEVKARVETTEELVLQQNPKAEQPLPNAPKRSLQPCCQLGPQPQPNCAPHRAPNRANCSPAPYRWSSEACAFHVEGERWKLTPTEAQRFGGKCPWNCIVFACVL